VEEDQGDEGELYPGVLRLVRLRKDSLGWSARLTPHIFHRSVPSDHRPITHIFVSMPIPVFHSSVWSAYIRGPHSFQSFFWKPKLGSRWSLLPSTSVSFRCTQHPLPRPHISGFADGEILLFATTLPGPMFLPLSLPNFQLRISLVLLSGTNSKCVASVRGDGPPQIQSRHVILCGVWLYHLCDC